MKTTTITLFVRPKSLMKFLEVIAVLENLNIDNNYNFNPNDLEYSKSFQEGWTQINMPVAEYFKLKYNIEKKYKAFQNK